MCVCDDLTCDEFGSKPKHPKRRCDEGGAENQPQDEQVEGSVKVNPLTVKPERGRKGRQQIVEER